MTTKDDAAEANTDTTTTDTAAASANAPGSAAGEAEPAKAKGKIPPPPKKGAAKPAAKRAATTPEKVKAGANADFQEPGSTLNPADPNAPNYRFEPQGSVQALAGDQSIDQGTSEQPPHPHMADIPAGGGEQTAENGDRWTDDIGPRGRVISVSRGNPSTTFEETLPHGATDGQVAAVKERLRGRFAA